MWAKGFGLGEKAARHTATACNVDRVSQINATLAKIMGNPLSILVH